MNRYKNRYKPEAGLEYIQVMELRKNMLVPLSIEDLSRDGEGIGKFDGFTVFVKDALPGDKVTARLTKINKTLGFARVEEIETPSPHRVSPRCPVSRPCGGCQIQNLSYERQLRFKEKTVRDALQRIGHFENPPMEPILGMEDPWRYRNKAQYPIRRAKDGRIVAGFYAGRTHSLVEVQDCLLGAEENCRILHSVIHHMEKHHIEPYDEAAGRGLVRHVLIRKAFSTGQIMVCLILNGKSIPHSEELVQALREIKGVTSVCININTEQTNVILGKTTRLLWGEPYITDRIGNVKYHISAQSFFQVNPRQTVRLYEKVLEYAALQGTETVWDLYCGTGSISMFLASRAARAFGVEIIPQAVEDARENAGLNGIENIEFFTGRSEEIFPEKVLKTGAAADVVVVDPPRKGCGAELLDAILKVRPTRIVYVSCDPATLARDLAILCKDGYRLETVCPVDMFPHTIHCEAVCRLVQSGWGQAP